VLLEDRRVLAVTAGFDLSSGTLTVQLDAEGDTANIGVNEQNLDVRDGSGQLIDSVSVNSVRQLEIGGNQSPNQTANVLGQLDLPGNLTVESIEQLSFSGVNRVGGTFDADLTENGGAILGTGSLTVGGPTILAVGTLPENDILLASFENNFAEQVTIVSAHNVQLANANSFRLENANVVELLEIDTGGVVELAGTVEVGELDVDTTARNENGFSIRNTGPVTVTGLATFNAGTKRVTLGAMENADFGSLDVTGRDVTIRELNGVELLSVNATGDFSLIAGGDVNIRNNPEVDVEITANHIAITSAGILQLDEGAILQSGTGRVAHVPPELVAQLADPEQVLVPGDTVPVIVGRYGTIGEIGNNFSLRLVWQDATLVFASGLDPMTVDVVVASDDSVRMPEGDGALRLQHEFAIPFLAQLTENTVSVDITLFNDPNIFLADSRDLDLNATTVTVTIEVAGEDFVYPQEPIQREPVQLDFEINTPPRVDITAAAPVEAATFALTPSLADSSTRHQRQLLLVKIGAGASEEHRFRPLPIEYLYDLSALMELLRTKEELPDGIYRLILEDDGQERIIRDFVKSGDQLSDPIKEPGRGSNPRGADRLSANRTPYQRRRRTNGRSFPSCPTGRACLGDTRQWFAA